MEDNKEEVVSSSSSHRRARSSVKREVNGHVPAGEKKQGLATASAMATSIHLRLV